MTPKQGKNLRLVLALIAVVLINVSGHAYFHLADRPLVAGDRFSHDEDSNALLAARHQCPACESLHQTPVGLFNSFALALSPREIAVFWPSPANHSGSAIRLRSGRAPPTI